MKPHIIVYLWVLKSDLLDYLANEQNLQCIYTVSNKAVTIS